MKGCVLLRFVFIYFILFRDCDPFFQFAHNFFLCFFVNTPSNGVVIDDDLISALFCVLKGRSCFMRLNRSHRYIVFEEKTEEKGCLQINCGIGSLKNTFRLKVSV